jgi:hypothetical protein
MATACRWWVQRQAQPGLRANAGREECTHQMPAVYRRSLWALLVGDSTSDPSPSPSSPRAATRGRVPAGASGGGGGCYLQTKKKCIARFVTSNACGIYGMRDLLVLASLLVAAGSATCSDGEYPDGSSGIGREIDMSWCRPCPAGKWNSKLSKKTQCSTCATGRFSSSKGASRCSKCTAGKRSNSEHTACVRCKPGRASGGGISDSCAPCAAGRYTADSNNIYCKNCPKGAFQDKPGE